MLSEILAEKLKDDRIVCHAMHPGWVATPGVKQSLPRFYRYMQPVLRDPHQGADTVVWLAAAKEPATITGKFWFDRELHATDVLPWTRASAAERQKLIEWLSGRTPTFLVKGT